MYHFFIVMLIGFGIPLQLWGAQYALTETHLIYPQVHPHKIHIVDRTTMADSFFEIKDYPNKINADETYIYVNHFHPDRLVIYTYQGAVHKTIQMDESISNVYFTSDLMCILGKYSGKLYSYDRKTFALRHTLEVRGGEFGKLLVHGFYAFITCNRVACVAVIDLQSNKEIKRIDVSRNPHRLVVYGDNLYVSCTESSKISIISLKTLSHVGYILTASLPDRLTVYKGKGYVPTALGEELVVIDMVTHQVQARINIRKPCGAVFFNDHYGYILSNFRNNISVFDPKTNTLVPENTMHIKDKCSMRNKMMLVDGNLYVNGEKSNHLFKDSFVVLKILERKDVNLFPYCVHSLYVENGEDRFQALIGAFDGTDVWTILEEFNAALMCGHPKAMAIAAFAYFTGAFGLNIDLSLWYDYMKNGADETFFSELCKESGIDDYKFYLICKKILKL